jgi:hypothetical protein
MMLDTISVAQHHDAITGTDTQYVDADYRTRISEAINTGDKEYKKELS